MDNFGFGLISEVNEDFTIKFRIPGVAEDCIAYPMSGEDQPEKDQNIVWLRIDNKVLGETFIYKKVNFGYDNPIEFKVDKYHILVNKDDGIRLECDKGATLVLKDDTIIMNGGENKGVVNISAINSIIDWLTALKGVFSTTPPITEPGNGLPSALQAACLSATRSISLPTKMDAEDTKVKH